MNRRHRWALALAAPFALLSIAAGASWGAFAPFTTTTGSSTATFGRTTVGTMHSLTADRKRVSRFSLSERGSVGHISAYLDGMGPGEGSSQSARFVVYADSAGSPGALLGVTQSYAIAKRAAAKWVTLAFSTPLLLTPGTYHLGIHTGRSNRVGRYAAVVSAGGLKQNDNSFTAGATNPFGRVSTFNLGLSIYASYTPAPLPSNTTLPTIAGNAVSGGVLTAGEGSWSASPTSYSYAWKRCNALGTACASIDGAAGKTQTLTSADIGSTLRVVVTAANANGSASATSAPTGVVAGAAAPPPVDTQPPSVPQGMAFSGKTQTSISLVWNASSDNVAVAGYHLYRNGVRVASVQTLGYSFAGLSCGSSYTIGLEAYDAAGNASSRATATTSTDGCSTPTPPAAGTANVWVDTNGGTCMWSPTPTGYVDSAACATFDSAYDAANASSSATLILVRGGTYGAQTLTGNRTATTTITFDEAPGEAVIVKGLVTISADRVTLKNLETSTFGSPWENPDNKYAVKTVVGTTFVRFENLAVGGFLLEGSTDIDIIGGSVGPCRAQSFRDAFGADGTTGPLGNGIQPCYGGLKIDHNGAQPNRITVDGVDFHDFDYSSECVKQGQPGYQFPPGISPDTCHWRVMYNNGVHNFTLRNSTFRNSVFQPWFTVSGPDASASGNHNILIENNQFGAQLFYQVGNYGVGGALTLAHCRAAHHYRNVTIRFNSFANMGSIDLGLTESGCGFQNINVYGNIVSKGVYSCVAGVSYSYNVYSRSSGTCGGVGETNVGTSFPFYGLDTLAPMPGAYALAGGLAAPDNRVPSTAGCPATDARGVSRPQATGFCDAGAFER